ncbi:MAG: cadherin repeat domain-containing protein, partial [Gammaproteobacteria bacterium]|nr:cadherin repeat domain-containing protein [Gammaproteobacteria bacterium]
VEYAYRAVNIYSAYGATVTVSNSELRSSSSGVYIRGGDSEVEITDSILTDNTHGFYMYASGTAPTITGSTLTANSYGVALSGYTNNELNNPQPVITGNSIYDNTSYNYYTDSYTNASSTELDATGNWWGSTDPSVIVTTIYDQNDNSTSPVVNFGGHLDGEGGDTIIIFTITGITDTTVAENVAFSGISPILDGDTPIGNITYTISGSDADLFSVDPVTGLVSMVAQDYESPTDLDGNNVYEVTLTATDEDNNSANLPFSVTVTDVIEGGGGVVDTSYILNYEASSEPLPSDGTWNYVTGQTGFNFAVSSATLTNSPQTSYSGISQAYQFNGSGGCKRRHRYSMETQDTHLLNIDKNVRYPFTCEVPDRQRDGCPIISLSFHLPDRRQ